MNTSDYKFVLKYAKKRILLDENGGCCSKCGNKDLICLDFHHVNGEKEHSISFLCRSRLSKLIDETKKCIILCRNCHMEIHFVGKTRYGDIKKKFLELKGTSCCKICGYNKNISSLDFHHRDTELKDFNLSRAYGFITSQSWRIERELEKCDILCKNCHAIKHFDNEKMSRFQKDIDDKIKSYKELEVVNHCELKKMHSSGLSNAEISRRINCSEASVVYILKKYNLQTNTLKEYFPKEKQCEKCNREFLVYDNRAMKNRKYCSQKCMHLSRIKLDISKEDFEKMLLDETYRGISRRYNVSLHAVTNLAKRYGIFAEVEKLLPR